jgi:hypothetical protein
MTSYDQNQKAAATTTPEKTGGFGTKPDTAAHGVADPKKADTLHAEIKKTWGKLDGTEEVVMFAQNALLNETGRLQKFAFRLTRNRPDADDLLQSTCLCALEKADFFEEGTNLFG